MTRTADRYDGPETRTPLAGLLALLAEFGAVVGDRGKPLITPLGCWAAGHLAAGLSWPPSATCTTSSRCCSAGMRGNPWLRLLRREVEDLARNLHGEP